MTGPGNRSGDLYNAEMGDGVEGGNVQLNYRGQESDHHSVYGSGVHFSWDSPIHGEGDEFDADCHGTMHDAPNRPW